MIREILKLSHNHANIGLCTANC